MKTKLPPWGIALGFLGFTLILGVLDWSSGFALHFFVFYFMPMSFAAWSLGSSRLSTALLASPVVLLEESVPQIGLDGERQLAAVFQNVGVLKQQVK